MTRKIKQNENIKGIRIPTVKVTQYVSHNEVKISQLADDTVVFVDSVESGNIAMKEIDTFGQIAGPKLNRTKTTAITTTHQDECIENLQWTTEPVKYLGIYVGHDDRNRKYELG